MAYGHGKVILLGEHAVVYGHPALAVAIERAAEITWQRSDAGSTSLHIVPGDARVDTGPEPSVEHPLLKQALQLARSLYADDLELTLKARMSIPKGAGVGSSAALGVAVLRAMDEARGVSRSNAEMFERSFQWEAVFHGTPGGIDNYMATYGGLALFRREFPLREGVPISQQISAAPVVPRAPLRLVVADSGSRPPAIEMITGVRKRRERDPAFVDSLFQGITSLVTNGKLAIEQGNLKWLGQLMDMNHMSLAGLLLVSDKVEQMVKAARAAGALGAKMTGAGGGGCMIALVDSDERAAAVKAALAPYGTVFEASSRSERGSGERKMREYTAKVRARANIALSKYWGKSDVGLNLPAVPSISLTLDPMCTDTTVTFDARLDRDEMLLGGKAAKDKELKRAIKVLDQVRAIAKLDLRARIESVNNFPTASGLASSASGFAALVAAAWSAAGLARDDARWSAMARQASASAARSIYGGFVELPKGMPGDGSLCAKQIKPADWWDVCIVVAVASEGPKHMGSTEGMSLSERTSPYYRAWVECSDALCAEVREGILARDLVKVGEAMEQSTLAMHACMMASRPGLIYLQAATMNALATVRRLRNPPKEENGPPIPVYATMDAGPHVKALCLAKDAEAVAAALRATPEVLRTIIARPGPDLELNPTTPQPEIPKAEAGALR